MGTCRQPSVASRTKPLEPLGAIHADLSDSSEPTCVRIRGIRERRLTEAGAARATLEIFVRRSGFGAVRGDMPVAGIRIDARGRAIAASARRRDWRTAACADSRGGTRERERKENALDFGSALAAAKDVLLPDRDFAFGAGGLRERIGTNRFGEHRGLRAAVPGRAARGGAGPRRK